MKELNVWDTFLQDYKNFSVDNQERLCLFFALMLDNNGIKQPNLELKIIELFDIMKEKKLIDGNKQEACLSSSTLSKFRKGKKPVPFWVFYPACELCEVDYMEILTELGLKKSLSVEEMNKTIKEQNKKIKVMENMAFNQFSVPQSDFSKTIKQINESYKVSSKLLSMQATLKRSLKKPITERLTLPPETIAKIKRIEHIKQLARKKK